MLTLLLALSLTPEALTDRMLDMMTPDYYRDRGESVQWGYCRKAPGGCRARAETFAGAFLASGKAYNIDPLILAAVAWEESRFNPAAGGARGELGIMQVHPGVWKMAKVSQFNLERKRCLSKPDACQHEIVAIGADLIAKFRDKCGDIWQGIAVYHTGNPKFCRQEKPGPYIRRVQRHWRKLGGQEKKT